MTHALQQQCAAHVQVRVLKEAVGRLLNDEARLLGTHRSVAHIREVVLEAMHKPLLAARTVYTRRYAGREKPLATLGTRPLGDLLFARGKPRYLHRQFARLTARSPITSLVRRATGTACVTSWARRTVFVLDHQRLLVTEIFLPAMFQPRQTAQ